jgi:hypothetical protein
MQNLSIPDSSVAISRLGFGCARIFGGGELRQARALIEAAISVGITHFDTAPAYGSESVLGEVIGETHGITIATKIGIPRYTKPKSAKGRILGPLYRSTLRPLLARMPAVKSRILRLAATPAPAGPGPVKRQVRRDEVLREVEESLRCLRRTAIDLYLLHEPDGIEMTDELRGVFLSLLKDGVIKSFGLGFGGVPNESLSFGSVVQCRFPGASPGHAGRGTIQIYHGVVRYGLQSRLDVDARVSAGDLMARALERHPASSVIFSASSAYQIRQISRICRAAI